MSETFTLRSVEADTGIVRETKLTPAQALDLGAGKAIAYAVRDEEPFIDEDGRLGVRDSAIPVRPDAA